MIIGTLIEVDPQQWLRVPSPIAVMKCEQTVGERGVGGKKRKEETQREREGMEKLKDSTTQSGSSLVLRGKTCLPAVVVGCEQELG